MFDEFKSGDKGHMALVTEVSNTSVEHSSHYFMILNKKGKVLICLLLGRLYYVRYGVVSPQCAFLA